MIGLPPVNAFVLQRTPYREHSYWLRLLTVDRGQITALFRGVDATYLYQPYHVELSGSPSSEWLSVRHLEPAGPVLRLSGHYSYLALYLNELCGRLVPRQVPTEDLFGTYYATLKGLQAGQDSEPLLRYFERRLLAHLGVGIDFQTDSRGGPIQPERWYVFDGNNAFLPVNSEVTRMPEPPTLKPVHGRLLQSIDTNDYSSEAARKVAKLVFRQALSHHLGNTPLRSRALFQAASPRLSQDSGL